LFLGAVKKKKGVVVSGWDEAPRSSCLPPPTILPKGRQDVPFVSGLPFLSFSLPSLMFSLARPRPLRFRSIGWAALNNKVIDLRTIGGCYTFIVLDRQWHVICSVHCSSNKRDAVRSLLYIFLSALLPHVDSEDPVCLEHPLDLHAHVKPHI
jgi:hypothetical protein